MSKPLDLDQTLELLDRLTRVIRNCGDRARQLEREFQQNLSRLDRQTEKQIKELEAGLAGAIADLDIAFQTRKAKLESLHDRRQAALLRAQPAARKHHLKNIESREGRQINELQRELLQTSRNREANQKQTDKTFTEFQDELARERETLALLERKARKAFRGYTAFRRWLDSPAEIVSRNFLPVTSPSLDPRAPDPSGQPNESGSPEGCATPSPPKGPGADSAQDGIESRRAQTGEAGSTPDEYRMLEQLRASLAQTKRKFLWFRLSPLPLFFSLLPPWPLALLLLGGHIAAILALPRFGGPAFTWQQAGGSFALCLGAVFLLHYLGRFMAGRSASTLAAAIGRGRVLLEACGTTAEARYQQDQERIRNEAESRIDSLHQRWNRAVEEAEELRKAQAQRLKEKLSRASAKNDQFTRRGLACLQQEHDRQVERLNNQTAAERRRLEESRAATQKRIESDQRSHWQALETEWNETTRSVYDAFAAARADVERLFPEWDAPSWENWTAPREFVAAAPFARLNADAAQLAGALPADPRFALPGPARFVVPLLLTFPGRGSILFETKDAGRDRAIGALNNLVLRLLSGAPPGRALFTILDPLDLGQSFAGLMHLTDHEDRLIHRRIWTQPEQIEQRLAELNEHIEKVTQLYLRNEYSTIAEYNQQAGRIAEPYHFLVVADFPVNFSDLAVRRLLSVIASGPRCGVFTLIHWDQRKSTTAEFLPDDLRKGSVRVRFTGGRFVLGERPLDGAVLALDSPPDPDRATAFLDKVGRGSADSNRVEMPFAEIAPETDALWTLETTAELRVPIGRTGATKFQHLALGKGTRQHALIAGKTGSGKSTLFHVIITNLALWCSPGQVEFYLVDFKKGVEFKCYATHKLPHARVVAIESDREFGLSVLERVDEELRRRGDLFRRAGVQDLPGYKNACSGAGVPPVRIQPVPDRQNACATAEPLPRTLLIIDEFQEFFVEDDRVSQTAALLLDRLVRQGRAFGIHVLLGSQTLGGAYTLARTTLGQMVVRIALQCNEADALLIMDDDNPAPRLLSRPGEAIYNDSAGALEGNSPFQVVWLSEEERESRLNQVRLRADASRPRRSGPVVFEGNAPAEVRDNPVLQSVLEATSPRPSPMARAWLGAPNSIKGPTEVLFHRQSGHNLLIIGQRDEPALAMLGVSLVSLAAQHDRDSARFVVLDVTAPDSRHREFLEKIVRAIPHQMVLAGNAGLGELFAGLAAELETRTGAGAASVSPAVYLFIHGIQRFKELRYEDEFSVSLDDASAAAHAGKQLNRIIGEGPPLGIHVICTCDTLNNANRFFSRKTLSDFELRVLFQMSANDSAGLIDSAKAATLGLHRALLQNAQAGTLETFRPYALPDDAWIAEAAQHLSRR